MAANAKGPPHRPDAAPAHQIYEDGAPPVRSTGWKNPEEDEGVFCRMNAPRGGRQGHGGWAVRLGGLSATGTGRNYLIRTLGS